MFPDADIFTLISDPKFIPLSLQKHHVEQSFLAHIPWATRWHRHLLPLYPLAVEQLDLREYDLVITSDAGPMKGVLLSPAALHICYCHAPMRYVWDQYHDYRSHLSGVAKFAFSLSAHYVRAWDFAAAQRVTLFVANSLNVARRIEQYYARPSSVIYPPVDTSSAPIEANPDDTYLVVSRLVAYKRVDLVIAACNRLRRKLRVVGSGPEEKRLRSIAGPSIEFLGQVSEQTLWAEYARCRAFLFAGEEDFGMAPVEAQACGRPVIAYGEGGALESIATVKPPHSLGRASGLLFYEQTEEAAAKAILEFERREGEFDPVFIRNWASRFHSGHFVDGFRKLVNGALKTGERDFAASYLGGARHPMPAPVAAIGKRSAR
jgi:glycosyltransferase involved in cell wall biosynthesis